MPREPLAVWTAFTAGVKATSLGNLGSTCVAGSCISSMAQRYAGGGAATIRAGRTSLLRGVQ